jgi:hypothetical protein
MRHPAHDEAYISDVAIMDIERCGDGHQRKGEGGPVPDLQVMNIFSEDGGGKCDCRDQLVFFEDVVFFGSITRQPVEFGEMQFAFSTWPFKMGMAVSKK